MSLSVILLLSVLAADTMGQSEITPYHAPMLLGRGYDITRSAVGLDLFTQEEVNKATVHKNTHTEAFYRMVTNNDEANKFLGVKGELSLKIKAGNINFAGSGSYLKDSKDRSKTVEVLVRYKFRTVKKTLRSESKALTDCQKISLADRGTHYIRSVQYGGLLVGSLKFTTKNTEELEDIKAAVEGSLGKTGTFGLGIKGNFTKLSKETKGEFRIEYTLSATTLLDKIPANVEEFLEAVEKFPETALASGQEGGIGVPIDVELFPIDSLPGCQPSPPINWHRNNELNGNILDIEGKFDDLRVARSAFNEWKSRLDIGVLKETALRQFGNFNKKIRTVDRSLRRCISKLDTSNKADDSQFDDAIDSYEGDEANDFGNLKFVRELDTLQKDTQQNGCSQRKCPRNGVLYKNYCYMIKADLDYTWTEARRQCYKRYGTEAELASVATEEEGEWLSLTTSRKSTRTHHSFWLGAKRRERTPHVWTWMDETPWRVTRWSRSEPNDVAERCLEMRSYFRDQLNGRTWNDLHCSVKRGYVCKMRPGCSL